MKLKNVSWGLLSLLVALSVPSMYACDGDDDDDDDRHGQNDRDAGSSGNGSSGTNPDPQEAGADASVELTDGQIAGVLATVNTGEIAQGQLAQTKGESEQARSFGADMVAMHTAAQDRQAALLGELGISIADSSLSQQLKAEAETMSAQLEPLTGRAFDLAYLQGQVTIHTRVLAVIDQELLPNARLAQIRTELDTSRSEVAMHLEHAQMLVGALEGDAGTGDAGNDAGDAGP